MASLVTGLHPRVHGVTNHEGRFWNADGEAESVVGILSGDLETFAERFCAAGY